MEFTGLENLIKTRRSIRKWQAKAVPEDVLLKAIELATWAPNGGNQQNWRFYVIVSRNTIGAISDALQAKSSMMASWPEAAKFGDTFSRARQNAIFFKSAPAAIAVAASRYQSTADQLLEVREKVDPVAASIRRWRNIADSRIQSVASAIAYMLLILHQMGLGAVWMTGPMQAKEDIEKILKVPQGMDLIAFIPVGYPAENPDSKGRKAVAEIAEVVK
ncbi:MAG: nitroreductase family protein [Chloroflexota bacterium]